MAARQPGTPALKIPRGRTPSGEIDYLTLTFSELDAEVAAWVDEFERRGVQPGDRVLVMVRQGLPLIAAAFALFAHGAVPVVIDPGMGLKNFLSCVQRTRPRGLLGIPAARWISRLFWRRFRSVRLRVPASNDPLARKLDLGSAAVAGRGLGERVRPAAANDLAAILFTSGSTGSPKGVCYEHGMFEAQVRLIRDAYDIRPGEVDLPMLPIFALFNPALGMTTIVPEIDPRRPATVDPAKIVQAIRQENVTNSFGSPTLWNRIGDHCIRHAITLPTMKRVLCAGAPVPAALWEKSRRFLPNGELHSPYGATESLPISSVSAREVLAFRELLGPQHPFPGACVGKPVPEVQVKVIALTDGPIASWKSVRELPEGETGEIVVAGPVVTKCYDGLAEATAAAKIPFEGAGTSGAVWHRMGDCGFFDADGRLWFCGRKAEIVETDEGRLFTEPCEQVFRSEHGVARCALVGIGAKPSQVPALIVQPEGGELTPDQERALAERLRERGKAHAATRSVRRFYFHPSFPVDVRHNAKIHRLTLAKWAADQTGLELP
ncbi:peptide synthase [Opitutaceae bacterium EW11]|nr:peptide synthase [Opitutaceae bacterium EW11]